MDFASAISGLKHAELMTKVQFSVARKVLDNQKMQGAAAIQLIQAACTGASEAGDQLVAAATGVGGQLDTYA